MSYSVFGAQRRYHAKSDLLRVSKLSLSRSRLFLAVGAVLALIIVALVAFIAVGSLSS
jgi:hypothetical protein